MVDITEGVDDTDEEGLAEGLGDDEAIAYDSEKIGSPFTFATIGAGGTNPSVIFAPTNRPEKSTFCHWFSWPHQVRPHSLKPPLID